MALLTEEELKAMEANPATAAIAKKLRDAGDFIPKSRFDEVNEERKKHADALAKIEADRKAAEDEAARRAGDFDKLEKERQAKIAELEKQFADEKKVADQFREAQKQRVEKMKKDFGDAWLPEYESFTPSSLDKLEEQRQAAAKMKGTPDSSTPGKVIGEKPWAEMTPAERERMVESAKRGELKTTS